MTAISLFPLGPLWYAIRLMTLANRDAGEAEERIAAFQTLQSITRTSAPSMRVCVVPGLPNKRLKLAARVH